MLITKKQNILALIFNDVHAYFEEYNENKYFYFDRKKRKALENYKELWSEIKDEIETIRGIKPIKYEKDFMKIKSELSDDLPLLSPFFKKMTNITHKFI